LKKGTIVFDHIIIDHIIASLPSCPVCNGNMEPGELACSEYCLRAAQDSEEADPRCLCSSHVPWLCYYHGVEPFGPNPDTGPEAF
jgi:hypothetical protein